MGSSHDALDPLARIEQTVLTLGHGKSASLGHGIQNIYYAPPPTLGQEARATIAPPLGRLSRQRPLRGRHELIREILGGFEDGQPRGVHVVHGLAGSGKTSIALEIASQAIGGSIQTWWIQGNDASSVTIGMRSLANRIGVTEIELAHSNPADALWRRLSQLENPWLLIIDNVDDPSVLCDVGGSFTDGTGWVRPTVGRYGAVLITTRMASPSLWGPWCLMHQTTMLAEDDGASMLFDYVPQSAGSVEDAKSLSTRLGGLPLAIRLAALYLAETSATPWPEPDSITTIRAYHNAIDEGVIPDTESRNTFARAWQLSLQLLDDRGFRCPRHLLYLLSLFADTALPFRPLLDPATLGRHAPFHEITGSALWKTISALVELGMVDLVRFDSAPAEYLRIHPVVRDVTRIGDPPNVDEQTYLEIAAALVYKSADRAEFGDPSDTKNWRAWGDLTPHIVALTRGAMPTGLTEPIANTLLPTWCSTSDYLTARGMHRDAEGLVRLAIAASEQQFGRQNEVTTHLRFHLAQVLQARSKYQEAEAAFLTVLGDFEHTLGTDSHEFSDVRHCYADFLAELGEYSKAVRIQREVLEADSRLRGERDGATTLTKDCLARILRSKGDYKAALTYYQEVLETRTEVLGPDHDDTMYTRHHYAHTLSDLGLLDEAERLHRLLLDDQIAKHGPESPPVLNSRHCLSHLLAIRGDLTQATNEVRIAFAGRFKTYGETHPSTLELRTCLASLLGKQGQAGEAKGELLAVIDILESSLGLEHAQTLRARHELAHAVSHSGDSIGAQRAFSDLYATQMRVLGSKHAYTRETKACLDAERRTAASRPGAFPLHGPGKSSSGKKSQKR